MCDLIPLDYTINSFARNSRGGGIAILAQNSVAHRITYTSKFTFNHASFDLVHATFVLHNQTVNVSASTTLHPLLKGSKKIKITFTNS